MDTLISNADDSDKCRYISHVDFIRILRDKYREGTKSTFENIKGQVEQECERKKQQGTRISDIKSYYDVFMNLNDPCRGKGYNLT